MCCHSLYICCARDNKADDDVMIDIRGVLQTRFGKTIVIEQIRFVRC